MRLVRILLALALWVLFSPPTAEAGPLGVEVRRAQILVRREVRDLGRTLGSPPRLARMVATSAVGYTVGLLTLHAGDSVGPAAFASYVANVASDRLIDHFAPSTRPYGAFPPPSLGRHSLQMMAGAAVAGLSAPFLMSLLHPLTQHLRLLGDGAPGLISTGTRALFAQGLLRGVSGVSASVIATGAQAALAQVMRLHPGRDDKRP